MTDHPYRLTPEREVEIRALLRTPIEEWPRGEAHRAVAELLDAIEGLLGLPLVRFMPGDGTEILREVSRIAAGFPRGANGTCAFCAGDPCAETSPEDAPISKYMRGGNWRETCPFCQGRPT